MKIGIIGTNQRAAAIGRLFAGGGHDVSFGDARSPDAAERVAGELGAEATTPYRQGMTSDMLVFAVGREEADRALTALGGNPDCVIVDAREGGPSKPHCGAELLAHKLDSHQVVRALLLLPQRGADVAICGDDPQAKAAVEEALRSCGCAVYDRGPLSNAVELEPAVATAA
jgi:predicted dinucleotide-binding enzyme